MAKIVARLPEIPKTLLLVGELEEIVCTREPTKKKKKKNPAELKDFIIKDEMGNQVDPMNYIVPSNKYYVCASSNKKLVIIAPAENVEIAEVADADDFEDAVELHTDFHGVKPPKLKKVNHKPFDKVFLIGNLVHIVYSVPEYSERRGVPFIHEAGDKGDGVPPAKEMPTVCYTPSKDLIFIFGKEMRFTDRGIIG